VDTIQNYPTSDSPPVDTFESLVELYYQMQGYITSGGKWFWYKSQERKQRGYQDIDVLAISAKETVIVSVTSNLDDKIRFKRSGEINDDLESKLKAYYSRTNKYLKGVPEYNWLMDNNRTIRHVVAYIRVSDKVRERVEPILNNMGIRLVSGEEIFAALKDYLSSNKNVRIQHPQLRMLQVQKWCK